MKRMNLTLCALLLALCTLWGCAACTGPAKTSEQTGPAPTASTQESGSSYEAPVPVTGVKLNTNVLTLGPQGQAELLAAVYPANADNQKVNWSSSDESVLTVSEGVVSAVGAGTADVTVTTEDGGFTAVCHVLVKENEISVTKVSVDPLTHTMEEGETLQLKVTLTPANATNKNVSYQSSNEKVAAVDENGLVTALSAGTAVIVVTSEEGGKSASCGVTVKTKPVAVTGIFLETASAELKEGETLTLKASVKPENATERGLLWSSSNDAVLTVKDGVVSAISAGKATVTVKTVDGGFTAECAVTVQTSNVTATSVLLNKTALQLRIGQSETLTATVLPENARNKNVSWTSSDSSVAVVKDGKVTAAKAGTCTITVTTKEGGKTASATISVIDDDPIDRIDLTNSIEIDDLGGYNEGLRVKTSGELLFSPTLRELRQRISAGDSYDQYTGYLRFTYLPEDDDEIEFTYRSVVLPPVKSKGDWVDFFLQGDEIDCGFCPIAGTTYRIELVVVRNSDKTNGFCHGVYEMTAAVDYKDSPYYRPTPVGGQTIREEGQYYIRYAATGNGYIEGSAKQLVDKDHGSETVTAVPAEGYRFVMWSDGVKTASRSGDIVTADTKLYAYFTVKSDDGSVANIYIFTDSGKPVTSKNYEGATIVVDSSKEKYNLTATAQIRGRGNSSWSGSAAQSSYDSKNSYRLKFDEKIKLLGVGDTKNRDWVLQSNKFDLSGLRNWLVWDLANQMGTLPYVPECTWVQLYVNNEYRGMYMVCELIEVGKDRVDVDDSIAAPDKGFLLEFDFRGNYDDEPYFYIDGYGDNPNYNLHGAVEFCVKSKINSGEELQFIETYMKKCHAAIMKGDRAAIEELVDLPSFIDMYILEELSKDCDVGRASFFVQKAPGGKLFCTAPWDFDFGFGTYGPATSTYGLVSQGDGVCPWYAALVDHAWFREAVLDRMNELQSAFEKTMQDVRAKGKELESAADMNAYFWDMYGRSFHQYVSGQTSKYLYSYEEHIDFLVGWAEERWQTLMEELQDY